MKGLTIWSKESTEAVAALEVEAPLADVPLDGGPPALGRELCQKEYKISGRSNNCLLGRTERQN